MARTMRRRWFPLAHDLQKASAWKRISAFLFDGIILSVVTVLFAWGLSALVGYNGYHRTLMERYEVFHLNTAWIFPSPRRNTKR